VDDDTDSVMRVIAYRCGEDIAAQIEGVAAVMQVSTCCAIFGAGSSASRPPPTACERPGSLSASRPN
jgi:hypothetical protein